MLRHPHNTIVSKLCLACVLIGIGYLSLTPNYSASIITLDGADKLKHAFAYFVLGITASFAISKPYYPKALLAFWLMSGLIELLQGMQATRTASVYDLMANTFGLVLAYVIVKAMRKVS
ncbi:VanZ family protein [Vibrio sp. 10N.222.51.C12]|uniref:VanZ family protein n=1 Tax=Vibrio sp. 10N.222.51.C12 TaxID=3229622 RepID=UPI00354D0FA1